MLWMDATREYCTVSSCLVNTGTCVFLYFALPIPNLMWSKSCPQALMPNLTSSGDLITDKWYLNDWSRCWMPLAASLYRSTARTNGNTSRVLSRIMPVTDILSTTAFFLFLNNRILAILVNSLLSCRRRFSPEIRMMPSMEGSTTFMHVSMSAVAASSQSRSPPKDWSMGMMLSTAGNKVITFSAVMSTRFRSNPALMSSLLRVE